MGGFVQLAPPPTVLTVAVDARPLQKTIAAGRFERLAESGQVGLAQSVQVGSDAGADAQLSLPLLLDDRIEAFRE